MGFGLEEGELHILVLALKDFRVPCAGNPKIELKEKRLLKNVHFFLSPASFQLSGKEDFGVKSLPGRVGFTRIILSMCS